MRRKSRSEVRVDWSGLYVAEEGSFLLRIPHAKDRESNPEVGLASRRLLNHITGRLRRLGQDFLAKEPESSQARKVFAFRVLKKIYIDMTETRRPAAHFCLRSRLSFGHIAPFVQSRIFPELYAQTRKKLTIAIFVKQYKSSLL